MGSMPAADTSPDGDRAQVEAYRRLGGAGRAAVTFRLIDIARRMRGSSSKTIAEAMMKAVEEYRGDAEAQDDRTVVVVTFPPDGVRRDPASLSATAAKSRSTNIVAPACRRSSRSPTNSALPSRCSRNANPTP